MPILSTSLMRTSLVEKEFLNLKTVWNGTMSRKRTPKIDKF